MKRVKIVFLRHAKTEMNHKQIIQGWSDSPLTHESLVLINQKTEFLKSYKFHSAYSSDLGRAFTTCTLLLEQLNLNEMKVIKTELFREFNYGYFENKHEKYLVEEVTRWIRKKLNFIDKMKLRFHMDKSFKTKVIMDTISILDKQYNRNSDNPILNYIETYDDVLDRVNRMKTLFKNHPDETILIVSHGHFLNFLLHILFNDQKIVPDRIPNLSGFELDYIIDEEVFINLSYLN